MMPSMMSGFAFPWMIPVVLFCLVLLAAGIWLLMQWFTSRNPFLQQQVHEPHAEYRPYEQGYQPEQQIPEASQEGDQRYSYPSYEPLQTQYQEREQFQRISSGK